MKPTLRTSRPRFQPTCEPLEPRRVLATVLGIGSSALIGGDLTDPENDLDESANEGAGANFNWIATAASDENYFSPAGPTNDAALDVFDNKVGAAGDKWCCSTPDPANWVAVQFDRAYTLTHFTIASGNDQTDRDPDAWEIQGSNDGENWTPIFSYDQEAESPFDERLQVVRFDGNGVDFATPAPFEWFRYYATSTVRRSHHINELEFFGFPGLAVSAIDPADNSIVEQVPDKVTIDLTVDVDPSTVQAADLTINGNAATAVTIVDRDTLEFALPQLGSGTHLVEIAEGVMAPIDPIHSNVDAFSSSFIIPEPPSIDNVVATDVMASSANMAVNVLDDRGTSANVTLFWGTVDGETDTQAWQNSIDFGSQTNGILRSPIDGLQPLTEYFYRAYATNAGGAGWASTTAQFSTIDLTLPAAMVNAVDFVSSTAATISGRVTDTGGEAPNVVLYYGTVDGGNDVNQWPNQLVVGERLDDYAASIVDLTPNTEYYFTSSVENQAGIAWSNNTRRFQTLPAPQIRISEFMANNGSTLTTRTRIDANAEFTGLPESPDWIEIENLTDAPFDLSSAFLTDNPNDLRKWQFPNGMEVAANSTILVFFSGEDITDPALDENGWLHTSFGLSDSGEYLGLANSSGKVIFEYEVVPKQITDVSFGVVNGLPQYFATPTPGAKNSAETLRLVGDTSFSVDRGFYTEPITVEITSSTPDATIHYTTDGTPPSETAGQVFGNPILIDRTTTLRAIAFKPGMKAANVDTQTYIFLDDVISQSPESTIASGFPQLWGSIAPDYGMDPDVIGPNDRFEGQYAATIKSDLLSLPSISIVTDLDGVFGSDGIYTNPSNTNLEVPASIEMISEDGSEEFQINAGVKIQGGAFRSFDLTKKKSFRLKFKSEYGPSKLNFPLFGPDAIDEFDTLTLRMEANDGWQWAGATGQPQYARDSFGRLVQKAMGQPASSGRFVHVYLNGVYWGMYNIVERPDQSFAESYLDVDKEDWDGINSGLAINAGDDSERNDRTLDAWRELVSLTAAVREGADETARRAAFMHLQGRNPDGSNNPDQSSYLDVINYIDYLIVNYYGGNTDWPRKNYYLGRENTIDSEGFKFFMWDSEWSLFMRNTVETSVVDDPAGVGLPFQNLRFSEDFRLMFADRVQKHLFNGGPLYVDPENPNWDPEHPERNVPASIYVGVTEENFNGLVAESARWGDQHRATNPYTRDAEWKVEFDRLINEWFPQRTFVLLDQFREGKLFPDLEAPDYLINGVDQHGGSVSSGDVFSIRSPIGENTTDLKLIEKSSPVKYLLPTDNSLAEADVKWFDADFDDSQWKAGTSGIGFENRPNDYTHLLETDIQADWEAVRTSLYMRFEFELSNDLDVSTFERAKLRMQYDDGFVAYVNGQRFLVDSIDETVEEPINFDSNSNGQRPDSESTEFVDFQIDAILSALRPGKNVLAIHGVNRSDTSSDMLFLPELIISRIDSITTAPVYFTIDGTDPRAVDGSPVGMLYTDAINLDDTTTILARALRNGEWSPLQETTFSVNTDDVNQILISEINYNPVEPTAAELERDATLDNEDFEFIELFNPTNRTVGLSGLKFTSGIDVEFSSVDIKANEYAVVVKDLEAFTLRYGDSINVVGEFAGGSLANSGERISLTTAQGETFLDFEYQDTDPWAARADGNGATLQIVDNPTGDFSKSYNWQGSTTFNGSPGRADEASQGVVINEIVSNASGVEGNQIELHNPTNYTVDLSGWFLSDDADRLLKFQISDGTTIAPGGYLTFSETLFNNVANPGPNDFSLDGNNGGRLYLVETDASGKVTAFVDDIRYRASVVDAATGRVPNGFGRLAQIDQSLNSQNRFFGNEAVVISEVHFSPEMPSEAALAIDANLDRTDLEFVEIVNPTTETMDLSGWRFIGGIDFEFDAATQLEASQALVVISFNPENVNNASRVSAFRTQYALDDSVRLVGGYGGRLANGEDLVQLLQAGPAGAAAPDVIINWLTDEVLYDNVAPWPTETDGQGMSLNRLNSAAIGTDVQNWQAAIPTPGIYSISTKGDFNADQTVDIADVNLLCQAVRATDVSFDLNGDGQTTLADMDVMIEAILNTTYGDTSLDGRFNSLDLVQVFQAGEYEDDVAENSSYGEGDWNCDGNFTSRDLVRAFQRGNYIAEAHIASVGNLDDAVERTTGLESDIAASDIAASDIAASDIAALDVAVASGSDSTTSGQPTRKRDTSNSANVAQRQNELAFMAADEVFAQLENRSLASGRAITAATLGRFESNESEFEFEEL